MLLRDLTAEGKPAERRWEEVYGILIGNELSYWNADELKSGDIDAEHKPSYITIGARCIEQCYHSIHHVEKQVYPAVLLLRAVLQVEVGLQIG